MRLHIFLICAAVAAVACDGAVSPEVGEGHVATVVLDAPDGPIAVGGAFTVTAVTLDKHDDVLEGIPVTWTTTDTLVARLFVNGPHSAFVSTSSTGTATITAFSDGRSAKATITVVPIPVATIRVAPDLATVYVGLQLTVTAATLDSLGRPLPGRVVTWTSSNKAVATVSADGIVTAVSAGDASITASAEGKSAAIPVKVVLRPVADWSLVTAEWTTFQGNASHDGYVPATVDPGVFAHKWTTMPLGANALNPVTAGDGRVYVSSLSYFGQQIAGVVSEATGGTLWTHSFGGIHSVDPPAYANGTVYVATGGHEDSFIWGFDATNGDLRFQTPYGNQWSTWYAPVIQGDTLYMAGGYFGGMYAFSTIDGAQLWFHSLNQYDQFTPAVRGDRVFAYTGDYTPELTVVEAGTGTVIFEIPDPHFDWNGWSMNVSPVLGGLQNVLATQGGRLVSFDLVNRAIGYEISDHFQGNVTLASGVIYVRNGSAVNARAEATGSLQWTWAPPEGAPASTLIATKNILFASTGTTTYAVDVATHRQVWSYPAGGTLALTRSGPLLIAQSSGKLTAISLR